MDRLPPDDSSQTDLQMVNKYVFVEDYEKAEKLLKDLSKRNLSDFEIMFRRIDIATKNNSIDSLVEELSNDQNIIKSNEVLRASLLLSKIKHNLIKSKKKSSTKNSQLYFQVLDSYPTLKPGKKATLLKRKLNELDDKAYDNSNELKESEELNQLLQEAFDYYNENNQSYAACYLAGCAFYYIGYFKEAYQKLKESLSLNPKSTSTLLILHEMQNKGLLTESHEDYLLQLEHLDRFLVHGKLKTHTEVYEEFLSKKQYDHSIQSLKILYQTIINEYGNIPMEIELSCLLGIMKAYELMGNSTLFEAAKHEVENFVIAYEKSESSPEDIYFIGELCEKHGIQYLAKNCFKWILLNKESNAAICIKVANSFVFKYASETFLYALRQAYERHYLHQELRNAVLICQLVLKPIIVNDYMQIKEIIREFIHSQENEIVYDYLNILCTKFSSDPEIHFYLAEINLSRGIIKNAFTHFQAMYALDKHNLDTSLKYIYFLLRVGDYNSAKFVSNELSEIKNIPLEILTELQWCLAICQLSENNYTEAKNTIKHAINQEPWNPNYITLFIRCSLHIYNQDIVMEGINLIDQIEEYYIHKEIFDKKKY